MVPPSTTQTRARLEADLAALHAASFGWALACCRRDRAAAEDVLQQAYWKVLSGRATHDGRSTFRTWFFGVIRLTALEHAKRGGVLAWFRRRASPEELEEVPASSRPDPAVTSETARSVSEALASLPARQREVIHLTFYEGLTIAEAAEILRVSLGTARTHYERGKASMLAALAAKGVTP